MRTRLAQALAALVRAPALHFLVLGALLAILAARTTGTVAATVRPPIVVSAARVAEIRDDYRRTVMSEPTPDEIAALVAREADEEMLYREALLLGLDRGDRAVKWRIVDKVHFLYGAEVADPESAYRKGMALGLERDDIVVRNALVTKMRLLAKAASRSEEPTGAALDDELAAYLQAHAKTYAQTDRVTLTQVYLDADKRGAALEADAGALVQRLRAEHVAPAAAPALGDPFVSGSTFRSITRNGLEKLFGEDLADAVTALEPGRWSDPIRSAYGLHVVWVTSRDAGNVPPLAAVRARVLRAYRADRRGQYLERMMTELRAAYEVRVEG